MRTKSVFEVLVTIVIVLTAMAVSNTAMGQSAQRFGVELSNGSLPSMPAWTPEIRIIGTTEAVDINFRKYSDAGNVTAINQAVNNHAAIPVYYGVTASEITAGFSAVYGSGTIPTFVKLDFGSGKVYDRMPATLSADTNYLLVRSFLLDGIMVDGHSKKAGPIPTPSVYKTGREVGMMLLQWTGATWKVLMFAPEWCMNFSKLSYGKITVYKPNTVIIPRGTINPPPPPPNNPPPAKKWQRKAMGSPEECFKLVPDTLFGEIIEYRTIHRNGCTMKVPVHPVVLDTVWVDCDNCIDCQTVKPRNPDCPEPEKWCWGGHLTLGVNTHLINQSLTETSVDSVGYKLYGNVTATNTGASFGFSLASDLPTDYQIHITYGNGSTVQTYVVNSSQLNNFMINSYGNVKVEIPDLGYSRIFSTADLGQFDDEFFEYSETKETREESVYHIMPEIGYLWSYTKTKSMGGVVFGGGLYADLPTVRLEDNFRIGPYLAFGAQLPSEKGRKKHLLLKYYLSVDEWGKATDVEFFNSMLLLEYGGTVNFKVGLVNYDEGSTVSLGIGLRL
jgi:hypothetical protein